MPSPLGTDLAVTTDINPSFRLCSGPENLQNAIFRRLTTPAGALESIGDNPDYGEDVAGHLNSEEGDQASLARINARIISQVYADPRIEQARAQLVSAPALDASLMVSVVGRSIDGPFEFVANVDDMTVDRLNEGLPDTMPTTQQDVVGQTVTVVNQAGTVGATGPVGPAGAGAVGGDSLSPELDGLYSTDAVTEGLSKEVFADFGRVPTSQITLSFSALALVDSGATGTWRLRIGGTEGAVDGTVVATLTVTSPTFAPVSVTRGMANPGGIQRVKLTSQTNSPGALTSVRSTVAIFGPA